MVNSKTGFRELAYLVKIDAIEPIVGSDNCECAVIGGWKVMVRKHTFNVGDLAIYFEIDSKLDEKNPAFAFMANRKYRVKSQRYTFGGAGNFVSQGLLMAPADFGWEVKTLTRHDWEEEAFAVVDNNNVYHFLDDETRFLTNALNITYYDIEDNARKGGDTDPNAKYKSMMSRHPKFAKTKFARWMMRRTWGRKFLYLFIGKKKQKSTAFPTQFPYIHKSDEERIENLVFLLSDKDEWVKTTKIDGTSSLFLLERKPFNRFEYWVCSRNVRQINRNQDCYHDDNVYWEVNDKYNIENVLQDILRNHPEWSYVAIQGESAGCSSSGAKIQGDPHNFKELRFFAYNFITSDIGRWGSVEGANFLKEYNIPWVPIIDTHYVLPDDFEELKASATGPCEADGASGLREGYVYRRASFKDGVINSFKNVSREYLLKNN